MPTLDFLTGFPHRTASANGGGIYNAFSGSATLTIDTSVYKDSAVPQSAKIVCTTSNYGFINYTQINGQGVIVGKVWFYFSGALPSADGAMVISATGADSTYATIGIKQSTGKWFAYQYFA